MCCRTIFKLNRLMMEKSFGVAQKQKSFVAISGQEAFA